MKNELLKFWLPNPGKFADIVATDKNPCRISPHLNPFLL